MASYSKEAERQNKVLGDLLAGREPEKRIMVGYDSGNEPLKQGDKIDRLSDIMKEVRMPYFCPSCKKVMKKRLDDKFWRLMGHCFDCQIKIENKLRVEGKWEEYEKKKILENKKAYLKDLKQSIDEFETSGGKATFFNEVGVDEKSVEKEEWSMGQENFDKLVSEAREYIEKLESELENEIIE
jgi:ribosomal protein L37AE/L43A|tara:strand:+ start:46 stop:594 length:549 start_codon:yes stop_codon:yes gene_type:complete